MISIVGESPHVGGPVGMGGTAEILLPVTLPPMTGEGGLQGSRDGGLFSSNYF